MYENLKRTKKLTPQDIKPSISQKGVDMRIGLDIARIAIRKTCDALVIVTGDADLIPAMKLARIEGLRVYLHTIGHGVDKSLKEHADVVLG